MGVYYVPGKGWRYHFKLKKKRYTKAWFKTKKEANQAEAKHRKELKNPAPTQTQTDTIFLNLVNKRLDYMQVYHTKHYYDDCRQHACRWVESWGDMPCPEITRSMIQEWIIIRSKVSPYVANKEIRHLRALFNWGKKEGLVKENPADGINFLPINKSVKYIPPKEDIFKVILAADPDTQDYLWTIKETLARMNEVNQLTWNDIDFRDKSVILYTRKKKGGHRTPRKIPMTNRLYDILSRRHKERRKDIPWVFWQTYWSSKTGEKKEGPYIDRKRIMRTLCKKVGVKYFRFHALRHYGASLLDGAGVPLGSIQKILGHENRATTEIYLHIIGEAERDAMKVLEDDENKIDNKQQHNKDEG